MDTCWFRLHSTSQQMSCFVDDVNDFSILENDPLQLDTEITQFDLKNAVADVLNLLQPQIKPKRIKHTVEYEGFEQENYQIQTDKNRLRRMLFSLLLNSVSFLERFGTFSVKITKQDQSLTIQVQDTAMKIHEEQWNNIMKINGNQRLQKQHGDESWTVG